MPNHFHGILEIVGNTVPEEMSDDAGKAGPARNSLSTILGQFKTVTCERRAAGHAVSHPLWLRRWYDRVIRSDSEKADIRRYIWDNPIRWE